MWRENIHFDAVIRQNNKNQTAKPSLLAPPQTILSFNIYIVSTFKYMAFQSNFMGVV